MALSKFWEDYCTEKWGNISTGPITMNLSSTTGGYNCSYCGTWVPIGVCHFCPNMIYKSGSYSYSIYCYYPDKSAFERAYNVIKILVEEKIIPEPEDYKKFCELLEKIAKKL